ncbi:MAG TPA: T9SS type A sorting domain-containing protein [Ignavibacteria bacterium]|nr:T9SS type A sorting domain-containing protein [Ignavibacteria bacterium]
MKTLFLILFSAFALTHQLSSQWVYQQPPVNTSYYITMDFTTVNIGAAGGVFLSSDFFGRAAYTSNSGINWLTSTVPDSLRVITKIVFINSTTAFCSGAYNLDTTAFLPETHRYDKRTLQLLPQYQSIGGNNYKGLFMRSTNAGISWSPYGTLPANVYYLKGLHFVNANTGFASAAYDPSGGVNDGVIKTTNAGLTWSALSMPEIINNLTGVYFNDINTGYAVGYDRVNDTARGLILRTTNSGASWSRQVFSNAGEISGISFTNVTTGLAVSLASPFLSEPEAALLKTTNAGLNWFLVNTFEDVDLFNVDFVEGTSTALIYGTKYLPSFENADFVAKSVNSGTNWIEQPIGINGCLLFDAELLDLNNWYLTGGTFGSVTSPVILHTTNGGALGIQPVTGEIPLNYSLQQNYPNPFNPVTNIKFSIPEAGFVKLVVFDVTGKVVSTLISQSMKAGNYVADFDASSLTSGVYFYKLTSGSYINTKRMILVK